jgi:type IV pilus assembly protein PilB
MPDQLSLRRLLVESGLVSQEDLDDVVAKNGSSPKRLGELLEENGLLRTHQLAQFLSSTLGCPRVALQRIEIARDVLELLPREVAVEHHVVPIHVRTAKGETALFVATDDPTDAQAIAAASRAA